MPFKSQAQRKFLHARHPEIADRWEREGSTPKDLPKKKGKGRGRDDCRPGQRRFGRRGGRR